MGTPPADKSNSSILVYIDGAQVAHDPTDTSGWDYADATQTAIRFFGPVCSEIESGVAQHVTVTYPCLI